MVQKRFRKYFLIFCRWNFHTKSKPQCAQADPLWAWPLTGEGWGASGEKLKGSPTPDFSQGERQGHLDTGRASPPESACTVTRLPYVGLESPDGKALYLWYFLNLSIIIFYILISGNLAVSQATSWFFSIPKFCAS